MNERIKLLAEQAGWGATSDPYIRQAFDVNMFAELIVQECIKLIDDKPIFGSMPIKDHFGVT